MKWTILVLAMWNGCYELQVYPDPMICGEALGDQWDKTLYEMGQCIETGYPSEPQFARWVAPPPPRPESIK